MGYTPSMSIPPCLALIAVSRSFVVRMGFLSKEEKSKLGLTGGVKISKLMAGKLRSAGIKEGFIITSVDKKQIRTKQDLEAALKTKQGGVLIEGVYPNGIRAYYGFGI